MFVLCSGIVGGVAFKPDVKPIKVKRPKGGKGAC